MRDFTQHLSRVRRGSPRRLLTRVGRLPRTAYVASAERSSPRRSALPGRDRAHLRPSSVRAFGPLQEWRAVRGRHDVSFLRGLGESAPLRYGWRVSALPFRPVGASATSSENEPIARREALAKFPRMTQYGQECHGGPGARGGGRAWTLLIVRELLCGNYRFSGRFQRRAIHVAQPAFAATQDVGSGGLSTAPRDKRARQEYRLTEAGENSSPSYRDSGHGDSAGHAASSRSRDRPVLFMWDLRRNFDRERLPKGSTA